MKISHTTSPTTTASILLKLYTGEHALHVELWQRTKASVACAKSQRAPNVSATVWIALGLCVVTTVSSHADLIIRSSVSASSATQNEDCENLDVLPCRLSSNSPRMSVSMNHDELIEAVVYCNEHGLMDDKTGRVVQRIFRRSISDKFVRNTFLGRAKRHQRTQALSGSPFFSPTLTQGDIFRGFDLRGKRILHRPERCRLHSRTLFVHVRTGKPPSTWPWPTRRLRSRKHRVRPRR